jgi:hypothetical protein
MFQIKNLSSLLVCLVLTASPSHGFSINGNNAARSATTTKTTTVTTSMSTGSSTRKSFLQDLVLMGVAVATTSVMAPVQAANADVSSKLASSSALRNVKTSQKRLIAMNDSIQGDEYMEVKNALREAPVSEIRKACTTLVKGGEDGPDAAQLETKYKAFIGSLESMDSKASLALRGRKLNQGEFEKSYKETMDSLADFLLLAEEAASIPIQYSEEGAASSS